MTVARQNYTTGISCLRGIPVYEYDMVSAGLSVIKEGGLLPGEVVERLETLPKKQRNVEIGLLLKEDEGLLEEHEKGISRAIARFMEANRISQAELVSIKRDAVFTTRQAETLSVGDHTAFKEANKYSSFYNLNGVEFYYSSWEDRLDVKGLGGRVVERHEGHFLSFLKEIIRKVEFVSYEAALVFLHRKRKEYLTLELDPECYRQVDADGLFRMEDKIGRYSLMVEAYPGDDLVDVSFNYRKFLVPLISAVVGG
jgi:hypothetical protein